MGCGRESFDPQALTSLTQIGIWDKDGIRMFRSTGSYEPDHHAPDVGRGLSVSIHRLLRA